MRQPFCLEERHSMVAPAVRAKQGVLFISSAEHPGADTFVHMLIMRHLDREHFDVHVACSAGRPDAPTPGYQALRAIPGLTLRPSNFGPSLSEHTRIDKARSLLRIPATCADLLSLARYVRANRITVLHATDRPRDAVACALLGRLTGAKSVIHAHLKCADWMGRPLRWAMGQVDALIGVSRFVVQSLNDNGYRPDRTHAVLNAIELPRWDPAIDPAPVRRELRIPAGAPVVACAARLFPDKGQGDVLRAVAAVRAEFPDIRLLIIGRDDLQVMRSSYTEELKALAATLGVTGNVIFTGHRSDVPALFAASDVFALPSFEEPFGLVYAEAMAMKKPVLALTNGGAPEIVEHGRSGLLSAHGHHEELTAHLAALLRDPALRARMGEYGRQQVEARFTAPRMAADTARVYAALTKGVSETTLAAQRRVAD
jgi:glycosyltransferase involved in cell wall biosynthesis